MSFIGFFVFSLVSFKASAQLVPDYIIITPGDSCKSRTLILDASGSQGNIVDYSWEFFNSTTGSPIEVSKGQLITKNLIVPGIYEVKLTISGGGSVASIKKNINVYKVPEVDFLADLTEGCPPLNVTFTNNSKPGDGSISSAEWIFADGKKIVVPSGESVTNLYSLGGLFSPTLILTNSYGCKGSLTKDKYINVYEQSKPTFAVTNNMNCNVPNVVTFKNTSADKNYNYTWDFGDGTTEEDNGNNILHEYTKPGFYKISLTSKNTTGECSGYAEGDSLQNVYIGKPAADFNLPAEVCAGKEISFFSSGEGTGLTNAGKWYFEDDNTSIDSILTHHVFNTPGTWKVRFIAYNKYSKCESNPVEKTIIVLPSPQTKISVDNPGGCVAPHTINAQQSGGMAVEYVWNYGDGTSPVFSNSPQNISHTYTSLGEYNLTLQSKGSNGCTYVDTVKIAVALPEVEAKPSVREGCMPLAVGVKVATSSLDSIVSFTYDFGDGNIVTTPNDSLSNVYASKGYFFLKVKIKTKQGCESESRPLNINVDQFCNTDGDTTITSSTRSTGAVRVKKIPDCNKKYTFIFQDTTKNATVLYWNMDGDTLYGNANPIEYTFPNPTSKKHFEVSVLLMDNAGVRMEHGIRVVVVNEKPNFFADKSEFCKNTEVKFTTYGIDSSHIRRYFWDYGDYSRKDTIDNQEYQLNTGFYRNGNSHHTYKWRGNFRPKLVIEDKFGCRDSVTQSAAIKVKSPEAQFNIDKGRYCVPEFTVNFTETEKSFSNTPIIEWKWSFGDKTPDEVYATNTPVSHTYKNNVSFNNFQIRLTITDSEGCVDTKDSNVTSYVPRLSFNTNDTLRCNKFDIEFKNTSFARISDTNQYVWKYGDGTTSTGLKGRVTYADTGFYSVTLVVKDNGGCIDSLHKPAYVKLVKPKASFRIGSDTVRCVGTFSVPFMSTSTYSNYFKWDFGNGEKFETDKKSVDHFYKVSGIYDIKLVATGLDGCKDSVVNRMQIKGSSEVLDLKDSILCYGETFTAVIHGYNIKNYYWDFGDFTPTNHMTTMDSVSHVYKKPGVYYPNVIVVTPEGCQSTVKSRSPIIVDSIYVDKVSNIDCDSTHGPLKGYSFLKADSLYTWEGPAGADYLFGTDTLFTKANIPGTYYMKARIGKCELRDSVLMTTSGIVPHVNAGIDRKLDCISETAALNGYSTTSDVEYKWSTLSPSVFSPSDTVSNPTVSSIGSFVLTVTQKECSKSDTVYVSECSLFKNDSTLRLCPDLKGYPGKTLGVDLSLYDHLVSDTSQGTVSWYSDLSLSIQIPNSNSLDVSNSDTVYAKIVSFDSSETARAMVIFSIDTISNAPIITSLSHLCEGMERTLNASGQPLSSFKWILSGDSSHTSSIDYSMKVMAGRKNISGKAIERNVIGCNSDTAIFQIPVNLRPSKALIHGDSLYSASYCISSDSLFMEGNEPLIGNGVWRILKNTNGVAIDTLNPISHITGFDSMADTLIAEWNITNGVCPASVAKTVITPVPAEMPRVKLEGENKTCKGSPVTFKAMSVWAGGPIPEYSFYKTNGTLVRSKDTSSVYLHFADQDEEIYVVMHSDYRCLRIDTAISNKIILNVEDKLTAKISSGNDTICETGSPLILSPYDNLINGIKYEWSKDGKIIKTRDFPENLVISEPAASGDYMLRVYNNFCVSDSSSSNFKIYEMPKFLLLENFNVEYDNGKEVQIPMELEPLLIPSDISGITWTGSEDLYYYDKMERKKLTPDISIKKPYYIPKQEDFTVNFNVKVTTGPQGKGCEANAIAKVNNYIKVKIPNAITPNGDGLNDTWVIDGFGKYPNTKINVFNRWGNLVFENRLGNNTPWNGTDQGRVLPAGTYYYVIEFKGSNDYSDFNENGSLTIVY